MRHSEILSYSQQAICEDSWSDSDCCSNKLHILAWAWQHCQEDLFCITHWTSVCSQFTWSDIWLSAYHICSSEDDAQEASQCKMILILIELLFKNFMKNKNWMMFDSIRINTCASIFTWHAFIKSHSVIVLTCIFYDMMIDFSVMFIVCANNSEAFITWI